MFFDIQPHADDVALLSCFPQDLLEQGAKDPLPPGVGLDINTLKPPKPAVSPVAPFESKHYLSKHYAILFRQKVDTLLGIPEAALHANLERG